ncbi:MAG: hypothetical protein WBM14_17675 [Terracidiphilus sp.]
MVNLENLLTVSSLAITGWKRIVEIQGVVRFIRNPSGAGNRFLNEPLLCR